MEATELYREGVTHALAGFQLLEEQLKNYVEMHFDCMRLVLGDRFHFDFSRADYQDASLGRLVSVFAKLCPNKELVVALRAVVKQRNHIAHQALLKLYSTPLSSSTDYASLLSETNALVQHVSSLLTRVVQEMAKLPEALART